MTLQHFPSKVDSNGQSCCTAEERPVITSSDSAIGCEIGVTGFEPATSTSQTTRSNGAMATVIADAPDAIIRAGLHQHVTVSTKKEVT